MTPIATVDLDRIHDIQKEKRIFTIRRKIFVFLATCLYLDPDIDLEIALKLRPYGGLIVIENSLLDNYFTSFKVLRLHAMLHDASGFVYEYSEEGPGYS